MRGKSDVTEQKVCRSCSSTELEEIISLGDLALSKFVKRTTKLKRYPLDLILCTKCMLVQLRYTTSSDLLYTENYGYRSGINDTMQKELREIVNKSLRKVKKQEKQMLVVDIGANDGTLLKNYGEETTTVGVEPIKKLAKECKNNAAIVINDFFNFASYQKAVGSRKALIVTIISCFYDMQDPNQFVTDVKNILDEDGIIVIQQNYLPAMLKLNAFDNIVHEHLEYYSLLALTNLLSKHDLEVFDVETNRVNGGSFRIYICLKNKRPVAQSVRIMLQAEKDAHLDTKKPYHDFAKRVQTNGEALKKFIKTQTQEGKIVYLYGASTRGNTLLQYYGLNNKLISAAVERNPEKWGTKIGSVDIPIISEAQARKDRPDYMLVLPWFFREEFLQREKAYLASGGHFIFPLPNFEIV